MPRRMTQASGGSGIRSRSSTTPWIMPSSHTIVIAAPMIVNNVLSNGVALLKWLARPRTT